MLSQHDSFNDVKSIIKDNNARSGVKPSGSIIGGTVDGIMTARMRPESMQAPPRKAIRDNIPPSSTNVEESVGGGNPAVASPLTALLPMSTTLQKPPLHPKPDALLAGPKSSNSTEAIAERFAQLRTAKQGTLHPVQDPRVRTRPIAANTGFDNVSAASSRTRSKYIESGRPSGPREMPNMLSGAAGVLKTPLDTSIPNMPKPPDAVYSPARNLDLATAPNSHSGAARSHSLDVSQQPTNTGQRSLQETDRYPQTSHDGPTMKPRPMDSSVTTITAESLYEYFQLGANGFRILLVDIRNREQFDTGHIFWKSIICIDPITLRANMSADELSETLILSPNNEQRSYEMRDQFDVVVFYDQCSSSVDAATSDHSSPLLHFSRAISEYSYEKRLKAHPILLLGGLDAWVDLMGSSALKSSDTAALLRAGTMKTQGRPLDAASGPRRSKRVLNGRVHPYESEVPTRGADSDCSWSSDHEGGAKPNHSPITDDDGRTKDDSENDIAFIRTTEEFVRRFPEASSMKQSMIYGPPSYAGEASSGVSRLTSDYNNSQGHSGPQNSTFAASSSTLVRPPAVPRPSYQGLSRKSWDYQTVQDLPRISARSNSAVAPTPPRPTKGLYNYHNTCYMNSTIQCLGHTPTLKNALQHQIAPASGGVDPQLAVTPVLNALLDQLWNGPGQSVRPDDFRVGIPYRTLEKVLSCNRSALLQSVRPILPTRACQVTISKTPTNFCL